MTDNLSDKFIQCIETIRDVTEPRKCIEPQLPPQDFDFGSLINPTFTMSKVGAGWITTNIKGYEIGNEDKDGDSSDDDYTQRGGDMMPNLFIDIKDLPKPPATLDFSKKIEAKPAELEKINVKKDPIKEEDKPATIAAAILDAVCTISDGLKKLYHEYQNRSRWSVLNFFAKNPKGETQKFMNEVAEQLTDAFSDFTKPEGKGSIFILFVLLKLASESFL